MKCKRLFISCGGTGGHFFPGLAVAREAAERGSEVLLLLSGVNSQAQSISAAGKGIPSCVLPRMPSPGRSPLRFLYFAFGCGTGFLMMLWKFIICRPDVLLIMGSFASLPAFLAAKILFIPIVLHDGNARIGKANRFISSSARFLGAAFPPVNGECCKCKVYHTGMPLRPELEDNCGILKVEAITALNAIFDADLSPERFTVLVFGGSQGAATFNRILPEALGKIGAEKIQVLHLTGRGKLEETCKLYRGYPGLKCIVAESSDRMELFLSSADAVFCRSGGSTVAELTLYGKCAVLIPYPHAAEMHQDDNARFFVESGGGIMVRDDEFSVEKAQELLQQLSSDKELLEKFRKGSASAAVPGAAGKLLDRIADEV